MSVEVLIDPAIALVDARGTLQEIAAKWHRFLEWQLDDRTRLGVATYELLGTFYANLDGDAQTIPKSLKPSVFRGVANMLQRGPAGKSSASTSVLADAYSGSREHELAITADIAGTAESPHIVIGTLPENWPSGATVTGLVPPPPAAVPFHFRPFLPTRAEERATYSDRYSTMSFVIVGGQIESRIVERLDVDLGIPAERVRWIPSERNKKPRNLESLARGASQSSTAIVCITGAVGHSTSEALASACSRYGTTYIEVRAANGIAAAIISEC